jgi:beta-galactosidase
VQGAFYDPLIRSLYGELGIERGPVTPAGVVARVVEGRTLYVNMTGGPVSIPITGAKKDVLTGADLHNALSLEPFGAALLE